MNLKLYRSRPVALPHRGTPLSAGMDFFVPADFQETVVEPGQQVLVPSGVYAKFDPEWVLIFFNKSGVATKRRGLVGAQVIDADYQGEIHLNIHNVGSERFRVSPGDKLSQAIALRVNLGTPTEVGSLDDLFGGVVTERGDGGFGSTGDKAN